MTGAGIQSLLEGLWSSSVPWNINILSSLSFFSGFRTNLFLMGNLCDPEMFVKVNFFETRSKDFFLPRNDKRKHYTALVTVFSSDLEDTSKVKFERWVNVKYRALCNGSYLCDLQSDFFRLNLIFWKNTYTLNLVKKFAVSSFLVNPQVA